MALLELLLIAAALFLGLAASYVLYTYARNQLALLEFRKESKGLPVWPERWPLWGNHAISLPLGEDSCAKIVQAHQEVGKTIGWLFNANFAVCTVDLELIKAVHDEPNRHINKIKLNLPVREFEESIMLAEDGNWRRLRRHIAPAFRSNKFKHPNVLQEIDRSIEKLVDSIDRKLNDKHWQGKQFQLDDLMHRYSLNLVMSCFYKQYDLVDFNAVECRWTKMISEGLEGAQTEPLLALSIAYPLLRPWLDWIHYNLAPKGVFRRRLQHFVERQTRLAMEARDQARKLGLEGSPSQLDLDSKEQDEKRRHFSRNMIDFVIDNYLDGKLTKEEYMNNSSFILLAADKTAADSLAFTVYQLAVNQDIQERLRHSIKVAGTESDYLGWVINESLRLMPPASLGSPRTVKCAFPIEGGHVVPEGTFVFTPAFAIHRLKEYWGEDADEFKPDRWRDTSGHHPMQYLPFGAGPRGCPGKEFALFEMKLLIVALMMRYHFSCEPKSDLYSFDSPLFNFIIPRTPTYVAISKLAA